MWAERGSRPTAVKQSEYQWAYITAAVNPRTGRALGVITPDMDTLVMNDLLLNIPRELGEHRHAVLVWDGAGYHTSGRLEVPGNITLLPLPVVTCRVRDAAEFRGRSFEAAFRALHVCVLAAHGWVFLLGQSTGISPEE